MDPDALADLRIALTEMQQAVTRLLYDLRWLLNDLADIRARGR